MEDHLKEEQILNFRASCPLKPVNIFEKSVIGDTIQEYV